MPTFPRYGRSEPTDKLVANNQIQETLTRDQEDRMVFFELREIGSPRSRSVRAVPSQFYVPGAPFISTTRVRSPSLGLSSDEGDT